MPKTSTTHIVTENLNFHPNGVRRYILAGLSTLLPGSKQLVYRLGEELQLPHPRRAIPYTGINAAYLEATSDVPLILPVEEAAHQAAKSIADLPNVSFVEVMANYFIVVMKVSSDHWDRIHQSVMDILADFLNQ